MALNFSPKQEQVASLFTAYRNDIDIFTEDQNKDKPFYKRLFQRLLKDTSIKINDVYPLGSSDDVITACKADKDKTRNKIYIVDGDIYMLYQPKDTCDKLFVLDAYCMENLVIDEDSICNTLYNFIGEYEIEEIKEIFNFNKFIYDHKDKLIDLFYHMAIQNKYCGFFELDSYGRFSRKHKFKINLVDEKIEQIKKHLFDSKNISEEDLKKELSNMEKNFPKTINNFFKIVSGKDYLIQMIQCHASHRFNKNFGYTKYAWKFNFANFCNLDRLFSLKEEIIKQATKNLGKL